MNEQYELIKENLHIFDDKKSKHDTSHEASSTTMAMEDKKAIYVKQREKMCV